MSADATNRDAMAQAPASNAQVAREAPTEQQVSQPGIPKKITNAQTVCNEKNQKGKLCNGHLKQMKTGGEEAEKHLRGDDVLFKCQTCGTLYMGPPLGHVRDPEKQSRFVEKELTAILRAAGGTLPAFKKSERGTLVPLEEETSHHVPASTAAAKHAAQAVAAKPAGAAAPAKTAAPSASGTDSSAEADRHRPAAEAQASTGQASAAPLSSATATASPAAGAETVSDLAIEASTELTPGAPKDERKEGTTTEGEAGKS